MEAQLAEHPGHTLGRGSACFERPVRDRRQRSLRAFWWRQLRQWHWISSAICLVGMLGFAATGVTLNHAGGLVGDAVTTRVEATLPPSVVSALGTTSDRAGTMLPHDVARILEEALGVDVAGQAAEWSDDDIYIPLPTPGGDGFVAIDRATGLAEYERTDLGWIAYANDLHKGRHTGRIWAWFLDVFAAGCLVFCLTGLCLLYLHAGQRPATWPAVAAGLVIPVVIGLFLLH